MKTDIITNLGNLIKQVPGNNAPPDKEESLSPILVNFQNLGYLKAGTCCADPAALENYLNQIKAGHILDENANEEKKSKELEKFDARILGIQTTINDIEGEMKKINTSDIPQIESSIKAVNEEILEIKTDAEKKKNGEGSMNKFNLILYWVIFIPSTVFLVAFYASAFHSGFYRDIIGEAQRAGADNINSIFNLVFNIQAFREINLHWLAPIIFFVFGIVLHISFDSKGWTKPVKLLVTLLFILMADCLLAYFIEYKTHQVKEFMGLVDKDYHFYYSPVFYMVLVLGYFTCLGWSIILHQIRSEYRKTDVAGIARLKINDRKETRLKLVHDMQRLHGKLAIMEAKITSHKQEIENIKKSSEYLMVSVSDLEKRVTDFYEGWLNFLLKINNHAQLKSECEEVKNKFYQTYILNHKTV